MKTQLPLILLLNAAGLALFFSWYLPVDHGVWWPIDSAIFYFFNHLLVENRAFLWLVVVTNNRAFDVCSLLAMGCLMLWFWLRETRAGRRRIVTIGLLMLFTAIAINQLAQATIPVKRISPTLFFTGIYRASELLHIPTKDASENSFPGDHGMMLLIFSAIMLRYFGKTAFIISLIIFIVFAFPRVMIGAHWFSDIAVGSLSVVLIGLPWWLLTPLSERIIILFERCLSGQRKTIRNSAD